MCMYKYVGCSQLASFPLYLSTGELEAQITQVETMQFSQDQLDLISQFQFTLFDKVLGTAKFFMIKDVANRENAYLIAPVTRGKNLFLPNKMY